VKYLLDTSAVSELVRPKPETRVVRWIDERDESSLFLSVLTIGELHNGIALLPIGPRKNRLQNWVDGELARRFQGRVLDVNLDVAAEWGRRKARSDTRGAPVPVIDSLIASTAIVHNLTVVTRNIKDFTRCGVAVYDPWTVNS
jgi:predicted nucleic acid-binding protein